MWLNFPKNNYTYTIDFLTCTVNSVCVAPIICLCLVSQGQNRNLYICVDNIILKSFQQISTDRNLKGIKMKYITMTIFLG